jgi:hypothetical protein
VRRFGFGFGFGEALKIGGGLLKIIKEKVFKNLN